MKRTLVRSHPEIRRWSISMTLDRRAVLTLMLNCVLGEIGR